MQERQVSVRIGVADTIGAAWAVAHFPPRSRTAVIVPAERQEQALRPRPIEALRLPPRTIQKLHDLDLRRVSQLLALPRKSLPSRFGKELLLRIDQALGHAPEGIVPERRPEPIREVWESESPLQATAALEVIVTALLGRLTERMKQRGEGLAGLGVELWGGRQSVELSLALLRPTTDDRHVRDLLKLQWERTTLPAEITRIQIDVRKSDVLPTEERRLWDTGERRGTQDAEALIEILTSRLGREAVLSPVLQPEEQPERASRYAPCIEQPRKRGLRSSEADGRVSRFRLSRPLWLNQAPVPVQVLSTIPDGPPHRLSWCDRELSLARCWGPERITTGWWRGEHVRRDYYHVETTDGYRLWLFRDWAKQQWFLHAAFD